MIYGDNPNKINEREDALGLKAYTYTPSISSIMQSGNLYVYGVNNPITFIDENGNSITLATFAIKFGIGLLTQLASDVIEYAYDTDSNKKLEFSSVGTYLWSGLSNTISFGISNPLLKTVAESTVSAFGGEIVKSIDAGFAGNESPSGEEIFFSIIVGFGGDCLLSILKIDGFFDEVFPETINKRSNIVSNVSPLNDTREIIEDVVMILPTAFKNVVSNHIAKYVSDKIDLIW